MKNLAQNDAFKSYAPFVEKWDAYYKALGKKI